MYNRTTLRDGGSVVEGLTLAVPWIEDTSYGKTATKIWREEVSWRTAASYDATQALIQAITSDAKREKVLENLKNMQLLETETSGDELKFNTTGERVGEAHLVIVDKDAPAPEGAEFGFKQIK